MTRIARLALFLLLAAGLSACVGSGERRKAGARPAPRSQRPTNPNADLVRPPKQRRQIRARGPRLGLPENSWFAHDREVHATIPKDQAQASARVYPWFEVPTYTSTGAELSAGDDESED